MSNAWTFNCRSTRFLLLSQCHEKGGYSCLCGGSHFNFSLQSKKRLIGLGIGCCFQDLRSDCDVAYSSTKRLSVGDCHLTCLFTTRFYYIGSAKPVCSPDLRLNESASSVGLLQEGRCHPSKRCLCPILQGSCVFLRFYLRVDSLDFPDRLFIDQYQFWELPSYP